MAANKKMGYEEIRAARLKLDVGDQVLVRVVFAENFGWNGRVALTFWKPAVVERLSKTTMVVEGISYMRETGVQRGGNSQIAVIGEQDPNTAAEIADGEKEIKARRALRYRATELDKEIDAAACDVRRLKGLPDIEKVNDLIDQITAIIGKSEKPRR